MKEKLSRRKFMKATAGAALTVVLFRARPANASSAKTYAYVIDTTKCIGCGNCVRACKKENSVPEGQFRTWVERYTTTKSGDVLVESRDGGLAKLEAPPMKEGDSVAKSFFVPKICNHCANPPCVQVCAVGATFRTADGVILVDKDHCMGCGYCVQACPYSARFMNKLTHTADKCTWCYHRVSRGLKPACATVCPTAARKFGEVVEGNEMHEFLLSHRIDVLQADLGTEPAVYYLGLSREVR